MRAPTDRWISAIAPIARGAWSIADMIRFGNGMGDIDRGGGVSGLAREDEAGLYWVKWHVDRSQGIPESDYRATDVDRQATISLSPRYAKYHESRGRWTAARTACSSVFTRMPAQRQGARRARALERQQRSDDRNAEPVAAGQIAGRRR